MELDEYSRQQYIKEKKSIPVAVLRKVDGGRGRTKPSILQSHRPYSMMVSRTWLAENPDYQYSSFETNPSGFLTSESEHDLPGGMTQPGPSGLVTPPASQIPNQHALFLAPSFTQELSGSIESPAAPSPPPSPMQQPGLGIHLSALRLPTLQPSVVSVPTLQSPTPQEQNAPISAISCTPPPFYF